MKAFARFGPWLLWVTAAVIGSIISAYLGMAVFFAGVTLAVVMTWRATKTRTVNWPRFLRGAIASGMLVLAGSLALISGAAALTFIGVIPEPRTPNIAVDRPEPIKSVEPETATGMPTDTAVPRPAETSRITVPVAAASSPPLTVTDPDDGARVSSPSLTVRGAAPPAADIVRDGGFAFWGDERLQADSNGEWSHTVELNKGENQLTFWLDDDRSQTVTIGVRYDPIRAISPPLIVADPEDGARVSSPSLTVRGAAPPAADIVRDAGFALWGDERFQADSNGEWSHMVELDEGENELTFWLDDDRSQTVTIDVRYDPRAIERTPLPTPTATAASQIGLIASLDDDAGDLQHGDTERAPGPGYADIREVVASYEDDEIWLTLLMDDDIPPSVDFSSEQITYGWFLDTKGDNEPEYQVRLDNAPDGGWIATLFDIERVEFREDEDFPGRGAPIGASATIRLALDSIDNPDEIAIFAAVDRSDLSGPTPVTTQDLAPDKWPEGGGDSIRIER